MNPMILWNARYEPDERKIRGVEYSNGKDRWNDFVYFHEYRHKLQHDKDIFTDLFGLSFLILVVITILVLILNKPDLFYWFGISYCIMYVWMEMDAWIYAVKRISKT